MFTQACLDARAYTIPVIIAKRRYNGECSASIGAAVLINAEGWLVTAQHIGIELAECSTQVKTHRDRATSEAAIRSDKSLSRSEQQRRLRELGRPDPRDVTAYAVLWGGSGGQISKLEGPGHIDFGVGKLEGVKFSPTQLFARFRNSALDSVGASICRSGFPFHRIDVSWDDTTDKFDFPSNVFPVPVFSNEGIVSRWIQIEVLNEATPLGFRRVMFETSSPGLKGQSGGPIFDKDGRIWGIQSATVSYSLGFSPNVSGHIEHQFLNVGRGVASETLCAYFDKLGIAYQT